MNGRLKPNASMTAPRNWLYFPRFKNRLPKICRRFICGTCQTCWRPVPASAIFNLTNTGRGISFPSLRLMTNKPNNKEKISRSALIIGLVSFLSDSSSEMIYPVFPIFLTQVLNAPVTVVGIIEGLTNGIANIIPVGAGWLSDRSGRRKPVAFVGFLLSAVSRPAIGLANFWGVVLGARFVDRLGKGLRSAPKQALLAESASASQRGRVFGYDRAMDYLGSVVGPLLCILFLSGF